MLRDDLGAYARALWKQWKTLVSGVGSILLSAVSAYLKIPLPYWSFWVVAIGFFFVASFLAWRQCQEKIRATRISVDFRDGWYALTGPNVAAPTIASVHLRLRLTVANRDGRNTTLSFLGLRVPGHPALVIKQAKLYPEGIVPATLMSAVDINAGQTLPAILEAHVTIPSTDTTPWGPTVGAQIDFGETFTDGTMTLSATVPSTP